MLLIPCPYCGPRDETEFSYGGEAYITRPENASALSDAGWADYVFMRANPKGMHDERWRHSHGCGRWFNARRDTVTHEIAATWRIGERRPTSTAVAASAKLRQSDPAPPERSPGIAEARAAPASPRRARRRPAPRR